MVRATKGQGGGSVIFGAHVILFSRDADADRAFLRDVLELPAVDAGEGWLIFALPPAEVGVHPDEEGALHELYLMCDDLEAETAKLVARGVQCSPPREASWGRVARIRLPGGGALGIYEPHHACAVPRSGS